MRIFVSYARADGFAAARQIEAELLEDGLPPWFDLRSLGSEATVWDQISAALKEADHLVVIVTPEALASKYVRLEWREARKNGATVVPVLGVPMQRRNLPRWLRREEVYDLADPLRRIKFIETLRRKRDGFRAIWDEGDEIRNRVDRPILFNAIKAQLLQDDDNRVAMSTALQGRGGYGKSALASMLARDDDLREAFIDGIFWVRVGRDRFDMRGIVDDLMQRTTGARRGYSDPRTAAEELRQHFAHRDALVIVDDVWTQAQLEPFAMLTGRVSLLVTTRNKQLVSDLSTHAVDEMTPDEALALLSHGLEPSTVETAALRRFAKSFWHWAQLLAISNALLLRDLRDGAKLDRAIADLTSGLAAGDVDDADKRGITLDRAIAMSLEAQEPDLRAHCDRLACMPEDTAIPLTLLALLWRVPALMAKRAAQDLRDLALIQSVDLDAGEIRLHDNILHYLKRHADPTELQSWHGALLDAARPASGAWSDLDADQHYLWRHLIPHLRAAGHGAEAEALLIHYPWIKAKLSALGAQALFESYLPTPLTEAANLTGRALALSVPALANNHAELGSQLWGRLSLLPLGKLASLKAAASADQSILHCRKSALTPPGPELLRLMGHEGSVRSAAFSPDGTRIVTASWDKTSRVWDSATGAEVLLFSGHEGLVNSAAFSPDGTRIVTASWDKTARVWDAATGAQILRLEGHESGVDSAAYSPDGTRIVTTSSYGGRVWDSATGAQILQLKSQKETLNHAAFSPDGTRIAAASDEGSVWIWDAATGKQIFLIDGHRDGIYSANFSTEGERIVTASEDETAVIWDLKSGKKVLRLKGHKGGVTNASFSRDCSVVVSASEDETVRLWDAKSGGQILLLSGHSRRVNSAEFAPDGRRIVTASDDHSTRVWEAKEPSQVLDHDSHNNRLSKASLSRDGSLIVSVGGARTAWVWDVKTGKVIARLGSQRGAVFWAAFSPNDKQIVTSSYDNILYIWDIATGKRVLKIKGHKREINGCSFSPSGKSIVTASDDRTIRVWDAVTGKATLVIESPERHVSDAVYSPDGERIITCAGGGGARIWDPKTGKQIYSLEYIVPVYQATFSPNGSRVVCIANDRKLRIWDFATGVLIRQFEAHEDILRSVAFSPCGALLVTASWDKTSRVWNVENGSEIARVHFYAEVESVDWRGNWIVCGDRLGRLAIFEVTA